MVALTRGPRVRIQFPPAVSQQTFGSFSLKTIAVWWMRPNDRKIAPSPKYAPGPPAGRQVGARRAGEGDDAAVGATDALPAESRPSPGYLAGAQTKASWGFPRACE